MKPETEQLDKIETGKEFSSKGLIESNLEKLYKEEILDGTGHLIILLVGGSNTGKTSLSLLIQQYLNQGEVNTEQIALDHDEWMEIHTSRLNEDSMEPPRKKIVYEEGRDSFFRTNATTKKNKEAKDTLYKYRAFQHTLLINFQNASDLAPFLVLNGVADAMFRCVKPGRVQAYGQRTMKEMWFNDRSRKFKGWNSQPADFVDHYKNPEKLIPEKWEEYRRANLRKLDQGKDDGKGDKNKEDTLVEQLRQSAVNMNLNERRIQCLNKMKEQGGKGITKDFLDIYSSPQAVNRTMQALRQKDLVEKRKEDFDNANRYVLTDKGRALLELF